MAGVLTGRFARCETLFDIFMLHFFPLAMLYSCQAIDKRSYAKSRVSGDA